MRRSEPAVIGFVAFLAIVMAFGVEAMLPAFDLVDSSLGFSDRNLSVSLMVTALLVGMGSGQILWGPLADAVGRRSTLIAGLALYAVGAFATALASSVEQVLIARLVWGIGAAAPNGLRLAVVRDLYEGDQMARIVTIATAVFLIGPVLMPMLGEGILLFGGWPLIAVTGSVLALLAMVIAIWFGETLPPEHRRPLRVSQLADAAALIVRTPKAFGAIVAVTLHAGAFFIYLGSAQPIIDRIYGRGDQFVWFFAASGLAMAGALLMNNRLIPVAGTARLAMGAAVAFVAVDVIGLAAALVAGGRPSIWVWLGWVCAANASGVVVSALAAARAMEPMGEVAGVAASVLAFCQLAVASLLAAAVDSRIGLTVTPMLVGSLLYGLIALFFLRWSITAGAASSTPDTAADPTVSTR